MTTETTATTGTTADGVVQTDTPDFDQAQTLLDQALQEQPGWIPTADTPENIALLFYARLAVQHATRCLQYETDEFYRPADPEILAVFNAAEKLQANIWYSSNLADTAAGASPATPGVASTSMNGGSVSFDNTVVLAAQAAAANLKASPQVELFLQSHGLSCGGGPGVYNR